MHDSLEQDGEEPIDYMEGRSYRTHRPPVYAISDGTIVISPYYFYAGTYAIEINHGGKIVRYGEHLPNASVDPSLGFLPEIKQGHKIKQGELIGYVGKLIGHQSTMLHLEMYAGTAKGPLTDRNSGNLYLRRKDIINPTGMLDGAKANLPKKVANLDGHSIQNAISLSTKIRATKTY